MGQAGHTLQAHVICFCLIRHYLNSNEIANSRSFLPPLQVQSLVPLNCDLPTVHFSPMFLNLLYFKSGFSFQSFN